MFKGHFDIKIGNIKNNELLNISITTLNKEFQGKNYSDFKLLNITNYIYLCFQIKNNISLENIELFFKENKIFGDLSIVKLYKIENKLIMYLSLKNIFSDDINEKIFKENFKLDANLLIKNLDDDFNIKNLINNIYLKLNFDLDNSILKLNFFKKLSFYNLNYFNDIIFITELEKLKEIPENLSYLFESFILLFFNKILSLNELFTDLPKIHWCFKNKIIFTLEIKYRYNNLEKLSSILSNYI